MSDPQYATESILALINRVFVAVDEREVLDSVANIRKKLNEIRDMREEFVNEPPNVILREVVFRDSDSALRLKTLEELNEELNQQLKSSGAVPIAMYDDNGNSFFTMAQFQAALQLKMGGTYGWRVDYVMATTAPGLRPVKNEDIQKWQKNKRVPDWAFHQIDRLSFIKRPGAGGQKWTEQESLRLEDLYRADPTTPNSKLAEIVSEEFGRLITDNSIKGELDRRRKLGNIDKYRPKP